MYVLYKFTPNGKQWFQSLSADGKIVFSYHQTDATHFTTEEAARHCIEDIKGSGYRANLSIEKAHV